MGTLKRFFEEHSRAAVGFSGGVDSAYLLYAAKRCGAEVKAYFIKTQFQPECEYRGAVRAAAEIGAELEIAELDILRREMTENPADRCYLCKKQIFSEICARAEKDGFPIVLDGTNASDDISDRPGVRALRELGVRSPLCECGITKREIRKRAREAGLTLWNKPSYACLATRIPAGTEITAELLERIENGENAVSSLGFKDFRLRYFHGAAKLQLCAGDFNAAIKNREELLNRLSPYFDDVVMDLRARK